MSRLYPKNTKTNAKRLKKATKRPTLASLQAEIIELQFKTGTIDQSAVDATLRQRVADLEASLRHERDMRSVLARRVAQVEATERRAAVADMKADSALAQRFVILEAKVNNLEPANVIALETDIRHLKEITGGLWRTADGRLIAIRQMSDNHLLNTKRLLEASRGTVPPDVGSKQKVLSNIDREIERRRIDLMWAERKPNPPIKPAATEPEGKLSLFGIPVKADGVKSPTGQRVAEAVAEMRRLHGNFRWASDSRGAKMNDALTLLESLLPEIV